MSGEPLGAFKTPLGAIEPNVLLAGLEGSGAGWLAVAVISDQPLIPALEAGWHWSFAIWGVFILLGVFLVGLIIEGLAGALERWITWKSGKLRPWYSNLVHQPPDWGPAQRWIWESPQASDEFARRRLRLLTARNTAFVALALTVSLVVGLLWARPPAWPTRLGVSLVGGVLTTAIFLWVWIAAQQGYNRAVQDAANIGNR